MSDLPRVLIVDDRRDNRLALSAVLAPLEIELVEAASGEEALNHLLDLGGGDDDFAVIILDVQMPVIDGFETARLIKARDRTRHIPIIFLTAISGDPQHFAEGYRTGAVDYIYKPFSPEFLRSKVAVFAELWHRGQLIARQREALAAHVEEVERLNAALERSNTALEGFAAMAAEQLEEPLANVAGMLELAALQLPAPMELIERARTATGRLQDHVARLLDVARLGAVPLHLEDVDLGEVAREALAAIDLKDVRIDALPTVTGDRRQLALLFGNLLDNCRRHAGPETPVRVTADGVRISVSDDGPGIPAGERPGLFTLFPRGPGLGLAICRRIVERHGGQIWVEPPDRPGTTISFTIPAP